MITSVEIPHLAKGQKIAEYHKIFAANTATLKPEQQLACLPVYIHRTEGEKKLAITAAEHSTLKDAFTFLEELIDGPPCRYTESTKFFNLLPEDNSIDGIRSYYFELCELAERAKIPSDICIMRFLTNVPGGKKIFESKEDEVKADLNVGGLADFFKKVMPKLRKNLKDGTSSLTVHESFIFPVEHKEVIPEWAKELQNEVRDLRMRVQSNDSGYVEGTDKDEETGVYSFRQSDKSQKTKIKKKGSSGAVNRPKCDLCGKLGHVKSSCFQRICECCSGKGHDAEACPSKGNALSKRFSQNEQRTR